MQAEAIGRRIRDLRLGADLSAEQLAARAETSLASISRVERGLVREPSYALLSRIATALGFTTIDAMLGGEVPAYVAKERRERESHAPVLNVVGEVEELRA